MIVQSCPCSWEEEAPARRLSQLCVRGWTSGKKDGGVLSRPEVSNELKRKSLNRVLSCIVIGCTLFLKSAPGKWRKASLSPKTY